MWFFTANDGATTSGPPVSAPGVAAADQPAFAGLLRKGNVVLVVGEAAQRPAARALAREVAGPDTAVARAAGQAIAVVDAPGAPTAVAAYAHGRSLQAGSAADPALRAFVEYWLGRAG